MAISSKAPMDFVIQIQMPEAGDLELQDRLTRSLQDELLELDVKKVELPRGGNIPTGAKSGEAFSTGALLVSLLPAAVPTLIEFLKSWVDRSQDRKIRIKSQVGERTVELEYSPGSLTAEELNRLLSLLTSAPAERPTLEAN